MPESQAGFHRAFLASQRVHILNITNHGIHQWDIIPGLTDLAGLFGVGQLVWYIGLGIILLRGKSNLAG